MTLGAQPAGQTVPRRTKQTGQSTQIADIGVKVVVKRHLAPSRWGRRDGDRAAQTNGIRLLPQVAFIEAHPPSRHAEPNGQFLDRILPPSKLVGLEPQRNLSGQRPARVAVEGELGQIDHALHLPLETRKGCSPGQRQIEGVEGRLDARPVPGHVGKSVTAEGPQLESQRGLADQRECRIVHRDMAIEFEVGQISNTIAPSSDRREGREDAGVTAQPRRGLAHAEQAGAALVEEKFQPAQVEPPARARNRHLGIGHFDQRRPGQRLNGTLSIDGNLRCRRRNGNNFAPDPAQRHPVDPRPRSKTPIDRRGPGETDLRNFKVGPRRAGHLHSLQDNGAKTFGLGRSNPHRVACRRAEPRNEAEGQLPENKPMDQPQKGKNQDHEESREKGPSAERQRGTGFPIHWWKGKPAPEVSPLKSCSPPHRMVRRATVPPRTIFTKDVSKVTRDPTCAREKNGKC